MKGKDLGKEEKRRGKRRGGGKEDTGVNAGQGRRRGGGRGAKYQYNNRPLEERRRGWRKEGGRRSLRHRERVGMEAEERMRRRNAEPEVSIDLGMTNERHLILRRHHPPSGKGVQLR